MEKHDLEKRKLEEKFMAEKIFSGLSNLNSGFDVPTIKYHSEEEFDCVLKKIEEYGIDIYGIEPFYEGEYYDCKTYENTGLKANDPNWYRTAFDTFRNGQKGLQYSASYNIPDKVLLDYILEIASK